MKCMQPLTPNPNDIWLHFWAMSLGALKCMSNLNTFSIAIFFWAVLGFNKNLMVLDLFFATEFIVYFK